VTATIAQPIAATVQPATVRPHVAVRVKISVASRSYRAIHVAIPVRSVPTQAGQTTVQLTVPHAVRVALRAAKSRAVMADVRQATPVMLVLVSVRTAIAKVQAASAWTASSAASVLMATVPVAARLFESTWFEIFTIIEPLRLGRSGLFVGSDFNGGKLIYIQFCVTLFL
jgi:hypothetical protein